MHEPRPTWSLRSTLVLLLAAITVLLLGSLLTPSAEALVSAGGGFYCQSPQPFGWLVSNLQFTSQSDVWATAGTQLGGQRLLHSGDAGTTWQSYGLAFDPEHDESLDNLTFVDAAHARALHAWSIGRDAFKIGLVKSDDGGATWAMTPVETDAWYPYGSCFPSADDVVLYGRERDEASGSRPCVMLTSRDGGDSWSRTVLPFNSPFSLWTSDMGQYWAWSHEEGLGLGAKLYTSTDGGATWQASPLPEGTYLIRSLQPVNRLCAWALVLRLGQPNTYEVLTTVDGGASWRCVRTLGTREVPGLSVLDARRAYLSLSPSIGAYQTSGWLEGTTDGGESWSLIRYADSSSIGDIVEGPGGTLLTSGMWRSVDGGVTWQRLQASRLGFMLGGVTATSAGTLVAVGTTTPRAPDIYTPTGGSGVVFRSLDGTSWRQVRIPAGASLRAVDFYGARWGWAAGSSGRVLRTTDGGASWRAARRIGKGIVILDIEALGRRSAVAVVTQIRNGSTRGGIARTTDAGRSWRLSRWTGEESLEAISSAGKRSLVVAGTQWGRQLRATALLSTDGGRTWKRMLRRSCDWEVRDLAFTDAQHGYLLASSSADWTGYTSWGTVIFRTADGGHTWATTDLGQASTLGLTSLAFADAKRGWAVGDRVLVTTNGGASWSDAGVGVPYAGTSYVPEPTLLGVAESRGNVWAVGSGQLILSTLNAKKDTAPPVTSDDGDRRWHRDAAPVHLTASDLGGEGVKRTQYRVDGGPWKTYRAGILVRPKADHSADGEHRVTYRSLDRAGNLEFPQHCIVRIDTRRPKTFAYGEVMTTSGASARILYRLTDARPCAGMATVTIVIQDSSRATVKRLALGEQKTGTKLAANYTCSLPAGSYTYRVTATDAAGNRQSRTGGGELLVRP